MIYFHHLITDQILEVVLNGKYMNMYVSGIIYNTGGKHDDYGMQSNLMG